MDTDGHGYGKTLTRIAKMGTNSIRDKACDSRSENPCLSVFIRGFYSVEVESARQLSRLAFAVSKNLEIDFASDFFKTRWNFFKSETKASTDREMFFRLASAMSRHISGEPDAMRVVSRKPVAHSPTCVWGCAGFKTRFTSVAATMCGRWLDRLTSKSCCAASSRSVRAPSDFQNCSSLRTALALDFFVGVTMQR